MLAKIKISAFVVSSRRLVFYAAVALLFLLGLPLLVAVSALARFVSAPLAAPSMIDIYVRGIDKAEALTADGWGGPVQIDQADVLIVSAVLRRQDFSSASVRKARDLARNFIEKTGYHVVTEIAGYVEGAPVYSTRRYPVYRVRTLEEVMKLLGFTEDDRRWARQMRGGAAGFGAGFGTGNGALLGWAEIRHMFPRGMEVTVTDVTTGLSFRMRRTGGVNHADAEPVTLTDSMAVLNAWGGWSWQRQPVVVDIGGRQVAASMNGRPHGYDTVPDNGVQGHFCIHFRHSRLHGWWGGGRECQEHQAMVLRAAGVVHERVAGDAEGGFDFSPYELGN
jgi:hypothetical protein